MIRLSKKKVCHFSSRHKVDDVRVFWKECRSLANAGYDVTYVGLGGSATIDGVKLVGIVPPKSRICRLLTTRKEAFRAALKIDADVYHFHDPELLPYGKKLKQMGKYVIFDSHELYSRQFQIREYIPKILKKPLAFLYDAYEASVCRRFDAVIFPTTVQSKNPFEGRSNRTVLIDNLVLLSGIDYSIEAPCTLGDCVCYIGSITPDRGVSELIQACKLAGVKLILCGNLPDGYKPQIINGSTEETVDYRGIVPYDKLHEVTRECFVGAATLLKQGQWNYVDNVPTKVYDYMLHYLPVLVSDTPRMRDFVRIEGCGLAVDPGDPVALAEAITRLKNDQGLSLRMGMAGHKAVAERLNWRSEEKKLLELYQSLESPF